MKENQRKANRLINESSPYLLQHAYNPVDWYAWGNEAFNRAQKEDKPILLSIGYSTCHWCHVMERESFENTEVAELMNSNFVCIKLDREERPDIDHIYMDAVQAMTGQGGWPLNVFLTPDKKPFYGGTYFPPRPYSGRPSWRDVLIQISKTYTKRKELVLEQSEQLYEHLKSLNYSLKSKIDVEIDDDYFHKAFNILKQSFDKEYGGYGTAPKFPSTYTSQFLLHYYYFYQSEEALIHALKTIHMMIRGGIYDQLRGGLCRYATDNQWLVPHFEKMLYDNANFINLLCDAYKLSGDVEIYEALEQTVRFIQAEFLENNNLFYSAYDADSEGVEGKYYCWTSEELKLLLHDDADWYFKYYNILEQGNWEHTNILFRTRSINEFAVSIGLTEIEFIEKLRIANHKLINIAKMRTKPGLDYKQITSWNAMMIHAFANAFEVLEDSNIRTQTINSIETLFKQFMKPDGTLFHQLSKSIIKHDALLEDYAAVIQSALALFKLTGESKQLNRARIITQLTIEHFWNEDLSLFQFTHKNKEDVIVVKIELFDSVIASGNSIMLQNLIDLNRIDPNSLYQEKIELLTKNAKGISQQYPQSFSYWLTTMLKQYKHAGELIITGRNAMKYINRFSTSFRPDFLILPLVDNRLNDIIFYDKLNNENEVLYYLCINNTCSLPTSDVASLHKSLQN